MEAVLISFLYLCLHVAIILIVAYAIVWICELFGVAIDGNVYKIGKIIVMILIIIAVVVWLFSLESVGIGTRLRPW
jgi:hypothetical protein